MEVMMMRVRTWFVLFLLAAVGILAQAQQKPQIQSEPAKRTAKNSGAEMYTTYCAVCHGADGKGNGPATAALKKAPSDLTLLNKNNGGKYPSIRVARLIEGEDVLASHGSRDMPIWGNIFRGMGSPGEGDKEVKIRVNSINEYLMSIQQK
jgi:mono/diheme cytochrome c family protein